MLKLIKIYNRLINVLKEFNINIPNSGSQQFNMRSIENNTTDCVYLKVHRYDEEKEFTIIMFDNTYSKQTLEWLYNRGVFKRDVVNNSENKSSIELETTETSLLSNGVNILDDEIQRIIERNRESIRAISAGESPTFYSEPEDNN